MRKTLARIVALVALLLTSMLTARPAVAEVSLKVSAQGVARVHAPVTAELAVPGRMTMEEAVQWKHRQGVLMPGNIAVQVEPVHDQTGTNVTSVRLHWVEPALKADETKTYRLEIARNESVPVKFSVVDAQSTRDLKFGDRLVWRHDVLKYDPANHVPTFKHFHQVYAFDGKGFITQGVNGKQFPHHRGLYMGWAKTGFNGQTYDTWHCSKNVSLRHDAFVTAKETLGAVTARSVSRAKWLTGDEKTILTEERSVQTWLAGQGLVVMDFRFTLTSGGGDVKLDGDPQHAGFQFRAAPEVGASKAKYVYPANVKGKGGDVWADCLWVANNFAIQGRPYTVVHMDHPKNPGTAEGKTVYSTRNYGRFGAYASVLLKADQPLTFNYRILVRDAAEHSDLSVEHFQSLHDGWVTPVKVE